MTDMEAAAVISIAFIKRQAVNRHGDPGGWLARAFHEAGQPVLLADADHAGIARAVPGSRGFRAVSGAGRAAVVLRAAQPDGRERPAQRPWPGRPWRRPGSRCPA